ncbi:unnamed protein product [Schistosoma curassoni]|uniref:Uncharacterized protein n=1 Tax=Schistosoma curassoni TaxID=6186 RepID=A0A183L3U6_9TREM|nr:unnamed protein product [Schistosoma curassoni]
MFSYYPLCQTDQLNQCYQHVKFLLDYQPMIENMALMIMIMIHVVLHCSKHLIENLH